MMIEVAIGDRVRTVSVIRKGTLLHVDLNGRAFIVDARRIDENVVSMLVQQGEHGAPSRSVDAAFAAGLSPGELDVHLAGRTVPLQIRRAGAFGRQKKEGSHGAASGPHRVIAPMPGRVVKVLVKPGDEVKARQGLVVVEAMKMENELRAVRDGRVRDVAVSEGQSVDAGTVLLTVE